MARLNLRNALPEVVTNEQVENLENEIVTEIDRRTSMDAPFKKGRTYLIRTVTMVDIGRVKSVHRNFIVLEDASWIPDTGRFNECLKDPNVFQEIEPFAHPIIVNLSAIIDATEWPHPLPRDPK